jgi:DNA (cytosine-5)-methyltransferase 1
VIKKKPSEPILVVDLFAGPGGLGEGFASLGSPSAPTFRIKVSAEMDSAAHSTLKLRAYFRALKRTGDKDLVESYYDFCNGNRLSAYDASAAAQWLEAECEAQHLRLGDPDSDQKLIAILDDLDLQNRPWVLIGGPPCQAYSIVGRSRNRGKKGYVAESDHRHFLYREYLKIIQRYKPTVFVMENVKGLISSKVGEQRIFHQMLVDLASPDNALGKGESATGQYRIHSLASKDFFDATKAPDEVDAFNFVVKAENFGVPQARHRVILLGVRKDLPAPRVLRIRKQISVAAAIRRLPKLRSALSRGRDSQKRWEDAVRRHATALAKSARKQGYRQLANYLKRLSNTRFPQHLSASHAIRRNSKERKRLGKALSQHFSDKSLLRWLNHDARSHMQEDLRRYLYVAAYADLHESGASPRGHKKFDLAGLSPNHKNWKSGKFVDRFRAQVWDRPATTITSHIAKDGHYYIHPDVVQCRSLTVREAARIQTFPDNYFFCGTRTEQYVQVGNAVPPFLARQIAEVVRSILESEE